jgi:hypothetical protein
MNTRIEIQCRDECCCRLFNLPVWRSVGRREQPCAVRLLLLVLVLVLVLVLLCVCVYVCVR